MAGLTRPRERAGGADLVDGFRGLHYHFLGVGGYGMSGLAQVLHQRGARVSGCDAQSNSRTARLQQLGIVIWKGHGVEHLEGVDAVVYSTDVPSSLQELVEAGNRGVHLMHRSEILAGLLNQGKGIAVAGTHGKTTTTAILGLCLVEAGLDPTVVVGGEVPQLGGTARTGGSEWVVAEACESDGSFSRYRPLVSVVTNVEAEHLEHHGGSLQRLQSAFAQFIGNTREAVVVGDTVPRSTMVNAPGALKLRVYGTSPSADILVSDVRTRTDRTSWDISHAGASPQRISSPLPGMHNVLNATAAAGVCLQLGVDLQHLRAALGGFGGVERRFEVVYRSPRATVVNDYAHHPTEIAAAVAAARQLSPRRLLAVFQPQRYSRTRDLWDGFTRAFSGADQVVIAEVYAPVGESPIGGVTGQQLAHEVEIASGRPTTFVASPADVEQHLAAVLEPGDLVLVMGAGDIYQVGRSLAARLSDSGQHKDG